MMLNDLCLTTLLLGIAPFVDLIISYMQAAIINSQTLEEVARLEKVCSSLSNRLVKQL